MKVETKPNFLNLTDPLLVDKSIQERRWVDYDTRGQNLNSGGWKYLKMIDNNAIAVLEDSYLIIEFEILKKDKSRFEDKDLIALVNNGLMHCFDGAQLMLGNKEIESYGRSVGNMTTAFGYLMNSYGFSQAEGLCQFWSLDSTKTTVYNDNSGFAARHDLLFKNNVAASKGTCKAIIPFNNLFGFKGKVIFGLDASINLNRKISHDPIYRASSIDEADLTLNTLVWRIPTLVLAPQEETHLYNLTMKGTKIEVGFLSRRGEEIPVPQTQLFSWHFNLSGNERLMGLVLFFQTGSNDNQEKNSALYNHCNLKNASVTVNSHRFHGIDLKCNFQNNDYMECYKRYIDFRKRFVDGSPEIDPVEFKILYPLFVFDLSEQEGRIVGNAPSVTIECNFSSNVSANTTAYALLLSDKMLQFEFANSDNQNVMKFLF